LQLRTSCFPGRCHESREFSFYILGGGYRMHKDLFKQDAIHEASLETVGEQKDSDLLKTYVEINASHLRDLHWELSRLNLPVHAIARILGIPEAVLAKCRERGN
jgi:hypothetical protein